MAGFLALLYGVAAYAVFLVTFLYAVAFVGNLPVPKTIDSGTVGPARDVHRRQYSAARPLRGPAQRHGAAGLQALVDALHPDAIERSTYVLLASLLLLLLYWQWRPLPMGSGTVESRRSGSAALGICWLGWLMVLVETFLINHFDLFGLRQVYAASARQPSLAPGFKSPRFYKVVATRSISASSSPSGRRRT